MYRSACILLWILSRRYSSVDAKDILESRFLSTAHVDSVLSTVV